MRPHPLLPLLLALPLLTGLAAAQAGWQRRHPAASPPERRNGAMVCDDAHGQCVLLFGESNSGMLNDGWLWNGSAWTQLTTSLPPARVSFRMAWDDARRRVVLFGGDGASGLLQDLWEWDGSQWLQRTSAVRPAARRYHMLAGDRAHGGVLLFGGDNNSGVFGDTWNWNGTQWQQLFPPQQPGPREAGAMAFDPVGGGLLLYGGYDASANASTDETWFWDGSTWHLRTPPLPPYVRDTPGMVTDLHRGRVVLFGGDYADGDTWEWDGSEWQPRSLPGPGPRRLLALAYDATRRETVLFGGYSNVIGSVRDTWVYRTDHPAAVASFAPGCTGSVGAPRLAGAEGSLPWLGDTLAMRADNLAASVASVVFATGLEPIAPLDLSGVGMPGCALVVAPMLLQVAMVNAGAATWSLSIPFNPALVDTHLFQQAFVLEPGANAAGALLSNGVDIAIGWR